MTISARRWRSGLFGVLGMLLLAGAARAQGTLEYQFIGQVGSLNPGSTVFPGISVGSPVQGWFRIDYTAADSDSSPNAGSYSSPQVGLSGTIGASGFGSVAHPGNQVRVVDGSGGMPGLTDDWTILQLVAAPGLTDLSLTFHDSTGQAIDTDALPGSAGAFSAFSDVVLYARDADGAFGQYSLNVSITQVPEPSVMVLGLVGVALLGITCQARRSDAGLFRSRAEPQA